MSDLLSQSITVPLMAAEKWKSVFSVFFFFSGSVSYKFHCIVVASPSLLLCVGRIVELTIVDAMWIDVPCGEGCYAIMVWHMPEWSPLQMKLKKMAIMCSEVFDVCN